MAKHLLHYVWSGILIYGGFVAIFCYYVTVTSPRNMTCATYFQDTTGKTKSATGGDFVTAPVLRSMFANSTVAHYLSLPSTRRMVQPVPVVNPHPFNFSISNSDACTNRRGNNGEVFLVLLVKCRPSEIFDREHIRHTWGGVEEVLGRRVLTMFLIGKVDDPFVERLVTEEDKNHHDLIQEDFKDTYYNLTYKNIMGWRWVSTYCLQTKYVMSIDVDMMINIRNLVLRLEKMPRSNFAEGRLKTEDPPIRDKHSPWYISEEEYAATTYPPFLNGACYVVTIDVAVLIFKTSPYVPFFKLDDVYVGMVLFKAGVKGHYSKLYEQFALDIYQALKEGIGIGKPHSKHGIDQQFIDGWKSAVGSKLEQDKLILPKGLFD